ncbi:hypothetical protein FXF51_01665 [Nonomuraea sp. PA05]|uniref:hypothetical protein n=1 Tax=Nonomuraea sp. PA05 TaxID=2604466 RepID=UPI0011D76A09|nr:hypothetical protein [Nonomuraea sp. PA05]TYB71169.1 hypothetical protein FXF51_01665 [Nonomuraea sp. PA05]
MTTSPHADHAANRAADLALMASHPDCSYADAARDLLITQVGPKSARQLIAAARAVLAEQEA